MFIHIFVLWYFCVAVFLCYICSFRVHIFVSTSILLRCIYVTYMDIICVTWVCYIFMLWSLCVTNFVLHYIFFIAGIEIQEPYLKKIMRFKCDKLNYEFEKHAFALVDYGHLLAFAENETFKTFEPIIKSWFFIFSRLFLFSIFCIYFPENINFYTSSGRISEHMFAIITRTAEISPNHP